MSTKRRLIAIVDDDEGVCKALKRLILASDMDAVTYSSGRTFLDSLPVQPPDCVLLDLHMPGLTGEDILKELANSGWRFPVIVITGRDQPANKAMSLSLGAKAYLAKPLIPLELRAAIDKVLTDAPRARGGNPEI